jgi:hypothetical protein
MMPCPHKVVLSSAVALLIASGTATAQTGSAPGNTGIVQCWDSFTRQIRTKIAQDLQGSLLSTGAARSFSSDRPTAALGLPECLLVR